MRTPNNLLSKEELDQIARRIKSRHRNDVKNMLATGADLGRVKLGVPHGAGWMEWLETSCDNFSVSKAENYKRAADWYATLSDDDKIVVTTNMTIESVIALSRKGVPLRRSILDAAMAGKLPHKTVQDAITSERKQQKYKPEVPPVPKPKNTLHLTNEDCLRLCLRLFDKLQSDAEPDQTLLPDLGRAVGPGQDYVYKIFQEVAEFINRWNLARQQGISKWDFIRPTWERVQDEPEQLEFAFTPPPSNTPLPLWAR